MRLEKEIIARINYLKEQIKLAENRIKLYNYVEPLLDAEKKLMSNLEKNINILEWVLGKDNCAREEFESKISRLTDCLVLDRNEKKCPRCGVVKSISEFYLLISKTRKAKTSTYCKVCKKSYDKERKAIKNLCSENSAV